MSIPIQKTPLLNQNKTEDNSTLNVATHSGRNFKVLRQVDSKVHEILKALNNREFFVFEDTKLEWIRDLGDIRDLREVPALIKVLNYKDRDFLYHVVRVLGKIRDARAVPALIKVLNLNKRECEQYVRMQAIIALGEIRDARAVPALIKFLNLNQEWFELRVRMEAIIALGKIGDARAVDAIIKEALNNALDYEEDDEEQDEGIYKEFHYHVVRALVEIAVQIEKMESEEVFKDIVINKIKVPLEKASLPFDPFEELSRDLEIFNELISAYQSMIKIRIEYREERIEYDIQEGYLGNITQYTIPHHILG